MSNLEDGELVIDEDELCAYISAKSGIDLEIVTKVLDGEMNFLESKGLVVEDDFSGDEGSMTSATATVDMYEMVAYIESNQGIPEALVNQILAKEQEYFESQE